ncbi:MAG: hypothetical protein IID40_09185, partial [Planctomycetes bacterium]|nr:hypothetical protein [Planctomycetota bacterium]
TDPQCRAALMRPLTALTLMIDFHLWPDHPVFVHVHSLIWYALVIWAAAVLYRRLIGLDHAAWIVGLAAILFAIDDAHGIPAGWLANRNALIACFFGIGALIFHDCWRSDGWRPGLVLAPLALFAGLLGKEEAVSTGGYLLAYAVFLDRGALKSRLVSLLPYLAVGAVWLILHRGLGHGVSMSEVYADPAADPGRFVLRVMQYAPILLLGQWAPLPSDLSVALSAGGFRMVWIIALLVICALAALFAPLLTRNRVARFWCLGMVLATFPISAIFPGDRLLMFVGLGAMGLLALWLGESVVGSSVARTGSMGRRATRVAGVALIGVHLVLSPLLLPVMAGAMGVIGGIVTRPYETLPDDPEFATQTAIIVNPIACIAESLMVRHRIEAGLPVPRRSLSLTPSCCAATLTRTDETTLVVRPQGGYLPPHRWWPPEAGPPPLLSNRYHLQHLDHLVRSRDNPMRLGETVELTTAVIEITALTDDGRPAEATFRFRKPLEDPSLRWFQMNRNRYSTFKVPAVGQTVTVPSPLD